MPLRPTYLALLLTASLTACGPGAPVGSGSEADAVTGGSDSSADEADTDTETGASELECLLAIRIDLCCNQPFAATPAELEAEPCVVGWPIDREALPEAVEAECTAAQPEWCGLVDCAYADPPTEMVGQNAAGACEYLCPEDTYLAYRTAGCGEPPPFVECLGIPPPCAEEYCSCAGETVYGCGQVSEPFEHVGPCE